MLIPRLQECAVHNFRRDGMDHPIDIHRDYSRWRGNGSNRQRKRQHENRAYSQSFLTIHPLYTSDCKPRTALIVLRHPVIQSIETFDVIVIAPRCKIWEQIAFTRKQKNYGNKA